MIPLNCCIISCEGIGRLNSAKAPFLPALSSFIGMPNGSNFSVKMPIYKLEACLIYYWTVKGKCVTRCNKLLLITLTGTKTFFLYKLGNET